MSDRDFHIYIAEKTLEFYGLLKRAEDGVSVVVQGTTETPAESHTEPASVPVAEPYNPEAESAVEDSPSEETKVEATLTTALYTLRDQAVDAGYDPDELKGLDKYALVELIKNPKKAEPEPEAEEEAFSEEEIRQLSDDELREICAENGIEVDLEASHTKLVRAVLAYMEED